jgi:hypothetical protein
MSAAKAKSLYVCRPVSNALQILAWAKAQGFKTTLPGADLHTTIAYSRAAVVWPRPLLAPIVAGGGARAVKPLGDEGAVVLMYEEPQLARRWQALREAGASWDYDGYHPHITITYNGAGVDLKTMEPYHGPIRLGGERFDEIDEGATKAAKESEVPTRSKANA